MGSEFFSCSLGLTKPISTRDKIINLLSVEWPLSVKEISFRINKLNEKKISYQAIHKITTQLLNDGILIKNQDKKLQLSTDWIVKIQQYSANLHSAYSDRQKLNLKYLYKENQINLSFENPLELGIFLCNTFFHYPNPKNEPTTMYITNNYPLIGMSIRDVISLKQSLSKTKIYCLVSNDTVVDRFLANFYTLEGTEFKFGIKCAITCDTIVRSDYVCNIYWPKKLMKRWTSLNKKVKYLKDFNLSDWFELINTKWGIIYVTINKNPDIANKIRLETISFF